MMTVMQVALSVVLAAVSLAGASFAMPAADAGVGRVFLEQGTAPSTQGWTLVGPAAPHDPVHLTVALKHPSAVLNALRETFDAVSSPASPRYGQHLTKAQVDRLTAVPAHREAAVREWVAAGVAAHEHAAVRTVVEASGCGGFLVVRTCAQVASGLVGVDFFRFANRAAHPDVALAVRARSAYTVPAGVAEHVSWVGGVLRLPNVQNLAPAQQQAPSSGGGGDDDAGNRTVVGTTASSIRKLYKIDDLMGGKAANNSQSVAAFLGQYASAGDLAEFFDLFFRAGKQPLAKVIGPNTGLSGTEASLDVQYIMSTGALVKTWFWSDGRLHDKQEPFLQWLQDVANTTDAPWVHSISYGDTEDSLSREYMERVNVEFQKLGVRGISVLIASGDSGVGSAPASGGGGGACTRFEPNFPASSPYVTAVGGSRLKFGSSDSEEVNGLSGGGFSNTFDAPDYQKTAVAQYLADATDLPAAHYFNRTGRAYPDVAALSAGFVVVVDRVPIPGVAGTSCASPTFAGVVSLLNDARLAAGKRPLGFLNTWLYSLGHAALNDITSGSNPGCGTDGFEAAAGWDPASGWGSPDTPALIKAALALP